MADDTITIETSQQLHGSEIDARQKTIGATDPLQLQAAAFDVLPS